MDFQEHSKMLMVSHRYAQRAQVLVAVAAICLACPARCAALDIDMTQTGPGAVERIADVEAFEVRRRAKQNPDLLQKPYKRSLPQTDSHEKRTEYNPQVRCRVGRSVHLDQHGSGKRPVLFAHGLCIRNLAVFSVNSPIYSMQLCSVFSEPSPQNAIDRGSICRLFEQVKSRGVNREKCDEISSQILNAAVELNAVHVKVW